MAIAPITILSVHCTCMRFLHFLVGILVWWSMRQGHCVQVTKPVIAWVSGTCAKLFKSEVQFGHAGAKSGGDMESAQVCYTSLSGGLPV